MDKRKAWILLIITILICFAAIMAVIYFVPKTTAAIREPEVTEYEVWYTPSPTYTVYENRSTPEPPLRPEELSVVTEHKTEKTAGEFSKVEECGWSKKTQKKIWKICKGYGIDFYIVMAMAKRESDFRSWITGDNEKAYGAWQIHYFEWKSLMDKLGYTYDDMYDPVKQADACCAILEGHYRECNRTTYALMAYNGGSAYAKRMMSADKVSSYADTIIEQAERWRSR